MQYHCLHIENHFAQEWQKDVFDQALGEFGVDTIDGGDYYIQSVIWEQEEEVIRHFCHETEGVSIVDVKACEDANWNEVWESEHEIEELPMGVKIVPHCAFGAGHHETTGMMIDALMETELHGKTVLDNGCGTGVLAIMAKKRGAEEVIAVDIDDKSVENTRENAVRNEVYIDVREGSYPPDGQYDMILSNIHRNILMEQMPKYAGLLSSGGQVWISGFLEQDCTALRERAEQEGLIHIHTEQRGEWRMMQLLKS